MIRVLLVAECVKGGVPLFVRRVSEGLNDGFAFGIACPRSSELYGLPPAGAAVYPVEIPHRIDPLRDFLAALRLGRIVRSVTYDIVHFNSSKAGLMGALLRGRLPSLTVFTPHALKSCSYPPGSLLRRVAVWAERTICRSVDMVVAVSAGEEHQLIEDGLAPPGKVLVVENGVDLDELAAPPAASRESLGVPADAFVVGTVGRLSPQKDPLVLVEAAGLLIRTVPNAYFVMVGDGPLEQAVRRRVAALGLSERMRLLGWRPDAVDVLKLFDVFVLTSRYEGMPFALLEAAGAQKALVCTAAPGVRPLIAHGGNGFLADVGDWRGVAHWVSCLYRGPDTRLQLGRAAFESIARPRGLGPMLHRWSELYKSLLQERVPTSAAQPVFGGQKNA